MKTKHIALALVLLAVAAAASFFAPSARAEDATLSSTNSSNPISYSTEGATEGGYQVSPLDHLMVVVFKEPEMSQEYSVSSSGTISFPLLDEVKVAGLTPQAVGKKLQELLEKDYMVHPNVQVTIKTFRARTVSVLGEVQHPGAFEITGDKPMAVAEAISKAGGFTTTAKRWAVTIKRKNSPQSIVFDYDKWSKDSKKYVDVYLQDGDVINVPQTVL